MHLKGGIFLNMENLNHGGGWNIRFEAVKRLVELQNVNIIRANAYMAVDEEREYHDEEYYKKKREYHLVVRRSGFHVELIRTTKFHEAEEDIVYRSTDNVTMAVDVMVQAQNLDYILLGTGDGSYLKLVRALQNMGKRVDILSFGNTDEDLRRQADKYYSGFLFPGLLPPLSDDDEEEPERVHGFLHMVNEEKGFGFITIQNSFDLEDKRNDIFVHITDFDEPVGNRDFALLKTDERILSFELFEAEDGKCQAKNVLILD